MLIVEDYTAIARELARIKAEEAGPPPPAMPDSDYIDEEADVSDYAYDAFG